MRQAAGRLRRARQVAEETQRAAELSPVPSALDAALRAREEQQRVLGRETEQAQTAYNRVKVADRRAADVIKSLVATVSGSAVGGAFPVATGGGAAAATPFDANGRIVRLDLTVEDFQRMSVEERLRWVQQLQKQYSDRFSVDGWFHNVEGILGFAGDRDLIQQGTWFSWVDAAILHGIQDGLGLATGRTTGSYNPGAEKWQAFFEARRRGGKLPDDATSKVLWGDAEQAATDYGTEVVAPDHGTSPNLSEKLILFAGNVYRRDILGRGWGGPVLDPRNRDFTEVAAGGIYDTTSELSEGATEIGVEVDEGLRQTEDELSEAGSEVSEGTNHG